jgi:hypothetical protein
MNTLKDEAESIALSLLQLGTPVTAIQPLVLNLVNENIALASAIPGVTPEILHAARQALKAVWAKGFHKVYYCAASFAAASVVAGESFYTIFMYT